MKFVLRIEFDFIEKSAINLRISLLGHLVIIKSKNEGMLFLVTNEDLKNGGNEKPYQS